MDVLLLRLFLRLTRRVWEGAVGATAARSLSADAVAALRPLLTQLPDLGRPGARDFLVATAYLVAVHKALPGRTAAENGALFRAACASLLERVPRPVRKLRKWLFFRPWYNRRLFASLVGTSTGSTEGFVGAIVEEGVGAFGVDYTECALQKFLARVGASELGPHVCALDFLESEVFDLGLVRTGTMMTGAPKCDFRWRRG